MSSTAKLQPTLRSGTQINPWNFLGNAPLLSSGEPVPLYSPVLLDEFCALGILHTERREPCLLYLVPALDEVI